MYLLFPSERIMVLIIKKFTLDMGFCLKKARETKIESKN
jgi:hypothetical protein